MRRDPRAVLYRFGGDRMARWGVSDALHVVPVDDLIDHDSSTDEPDCICGPEVEPVERDDGSIRWLIVHHSLDGRERFEG